MRKLVQWKIAGLGSAARRARTWCLAGDGLQGAARGALMSKRSKADDPTSVLTGRIARPVGSGPLPHDLPVAAWARLFAVALLRLQRAKPLWASVTAVEVEDLLASWLVFLRDKSLSKPELDMRLEEALEQLEGQPPWSMKARRRTANLPRGRRHKKGLRK
jgi:hypothetical protein